MFTVATALLLATLVCVIARAIAGPTVFDRLQAANTTGTLAMVLLAVIGYLTGRPDFLDLALTYGLLNVVGTIAVLKYFRQGDLGESGEVPARVVVEVPADPPVPDPVEAPAPVARTAPRTAAIQ